MSHSRAKNSTQKAHSDLYLCILKFGMHDYIGIYAPNSDLSVMASAVFTGPSTSGYACNQYVVPNTDIECL